MSVGSTAALMSPSVLPLPVLLMDVSKATRYKHDTVAPELKLYKDFPSKLRLLIITLHSIPKHAMAYSNFLLNTKCFQCHCLERELEIIKILPRK